MKKVLRWIAVMALVVVLLLVFAVGLFLAVPEITVPAAGLKWIAARTLSNGLELDFEAGELKLKRPEGMPFSKGIHLELQGVCIKDEASAVHACFSNLRLAFQAGWGGRLLPGERRWMPHLIFIDRFFLLGGDVALDLTKARKSQPKKTAVNPGRDLNSSLNKMSDRVAYFSRLVLPKWRVEGSLVEVKSLSLKVAANKAYSSRIMVLPQGADGRSFVASIENFRETQGPFRASAVARLVFPEKEAAIWNFMSTAQIHWAAGRNLHVTAVAEAEPGARLNGRIKGSFQGKFPLRDFELTARYGAMVLGGDFSLRTVSGQKVVSQLSLNRCEWKLDFKKRDGNLACGPQAAHLVLAEGRLGSGLGDPSLFALAPQFDLRVTRINFGPDRAADLELDFLLDHRRLVLASAALKGHFEQQSERALSYVIEGESRIEVARFARLVRLTKATPYAVPAPFNVLDGPIRLRAGVKFDNAGGEVDYHLTSGLDGQGESIHLRFEGATSIARVPAAGARIEIHSADLARPTFKQTRLRVATDATLAIDQLHLTAPRFDFGTPPRLMPDRRFGPLDSPISSPADKEPMDLRLRIRTKDPNAILITSNLTKTPIPVGIDLVYDERPPHPADLAARPAKLTGSVVIGETAIDAFRRNAILEKLKINLEPDGVSKINGRARVDDPQYRISVFLLGTVKEPVVRFASNPPLTDEQIIAVLLFGRPLNELAPDQKGSVANLEAAFADAALGLSSIYLLAHTPVESIGYDVERGLASVNVGIGGGASIELGTGSQSNVIGFRKRLGHGFVFRSDVETLGSSGKRLISALVEWSKWF